MNKYFKYFFISFISLFIFIYKVNAECSYQERKELLNEAKKVDITVSPVITTHEEQGYTSFSDGLETFIIEDYSFDFFVTNLSEKIYIEYYSDSDDNSKFINVKDMTDGVYKFNDNNYTDLKTYYFVIRSNNSNCIGDKFYTKKVVKPIFNSFSELGLCKNEALQDNNICKKFITKSLNLSEPEFVNKAQNIINESIKGKETNKGLLDYVTNYWYIGAIVIVLVLLVLIIIKINKKRAEL